VWVRRDTVDRGRPQRLEVSRLPSRASWASKQAQYVECARHHLENITFTCKVAGEHSLFAEPLRASSHAPRRSFRHAEYNFHLQNKLPQAICGHNKKPFARAIVRKTVPENGMPDIKIVTEVAGRVCALPVEVGGSVGDGDDIAFVEAMKMEIPVASPAAGKLKSILVSLDDVVAEGQVLAIVET
jgi:biotin carboxyl carrier protein